MRTVARRGRERCRMGDDEEVGSGEKARCKGRRRSRDDDQQERANGGPWRRALRAMSRETRETSSGCGGKMSVGGQVGDGLA